MFYLKVFIYLDGEPCRCSTLLSSEKLSVCQFVMEQVVPSYLRDYSPKKAVSLRIFDGNRILYAITFNCSMSEDDLKRLQNLSKK